MKFRHAICLAGLVGSAIAEGEGVAFFRSEVKPILERNCFRCHGGYDDEGRPRVKGGLQLISRRGLLNGGDHGPAFNEADPRSSLLLTALSYGHEELRMPPRGRLPDAEIAAIREWLEMGAPWTPEDEEILVEVDDPHSGITRVSEKTRSYWSYRPLSRPEPPEIDDPEWSGNPIDSFLRMAMMEKGVTPAPEASRSVLLRRLTYDLTGLPPSLEDIRDFESDTAPDAWEKRIDALLASPAYGEKWARHWLDVVRYGESNGFERDNDKPFVWRYRDYVIRAFNEDKPYDRFVMEQIAGDELPDGGVDAMIATGFHRLMPWDDEPADREQHFHDVIDDNLRTLTEGFLAMTVGCARCHDHKGDPIPQRDYYKFAAFLRGTEPMGSAGVQTVLLEAAPSRDREEELADLGEEEGRIRAFLGRCEEEALANVRANRPEIAERAGGTKVMDRWLVTDARLRPARWHYSIDPPPEGWQEVSFRAENAGWAVGLAGFGTAAPGVQARTVWTSSDIRLQTTFGLEEIPEALILHLYHDEDTRIFLNGQLVFERSGFNTYYESFHVPPEFMSALQTGRNVLAVHVRQTGGGQFFDLGLEIDGITRSDLVLDPQYEAVEEEVRARYREASNRLGEIRALKKGLSMEVLAVTEAGPEPPPTNVHIRGSAHAKGEVVEPGFPEIWGGGNAAVPMPPPDAKSSGRRLALARWIASPRHPRTARVMVNRIWQHHFGKGLCETPNDFGFLGAEPEHPELLDWLATEFIRRGWSVKEMHRLILTSRAYRTSAAETPGGATNDPGNVTFHRFLPRRLSAEELRDSILSATGQLNREMGGPGVAIPLPAEVLATSSTLDAKWMQVPPEQANRRSIYVKVKRSLPVPFFSDFDGPDPDNSCPTRFATIVPTQALAMMNSAFVHEKAADLAARLELELPGDPQGQVNRAFEIVLSRPACPDEITRSLEFIAVMRSSHGLSESEALQRFTLAVFNFNEFIHLD